MDKLQELVSKCKAGVYLTVNPHKDYYESVEKYMEEQFEFEQFLREELEDGVYEEMKKRDTVIEIQFYPTTRVGSYAICHYDLEKCLEVALSISEFKHKK